MGIKKRKPTNPASRFQEYAGFEELSGAQPHKPLLTGAKRSGARNNRGHVTVRFRGGGHRQGATSEELAEIKELKAKVRRLEEDNEILRRASIFFAGELDPRNR